MRVWLKQFSASRRARFQRRRGGYSLLEILIVLAIIALIATVVGPRLMAQFDRSKVTTARLQIRGLESALRTMSLDIGRYPTPDEGLALLMASPENVTGWMGPYWEEAPPPDPWGRPYQYAPPEDDSGSPRVTSLGSDGAPGGTGLAADIDA